MHDKDEEYLQLIQTKNVVSVTANRRDAPWNG